MKRNIALLACALFIAFIGIGCQKAAQTPIEPQKTPESGFTTSDRRVLTDRLSNIARQVEGVQNATVVITEKNDTPASGFIAMVGITPVRNADAAKIKTQVSEKIKASDQRISQVLVTTDPTLKKRIDDVAAGLLEGKPFQTMQDDINTINQDLKR